MDVEIRPYEPDDIAEVVALLNRCLTADPITSETFQRKVLLDQNFDTRGALLACDGARVVGFGLGMVRRFQLEDTPPDFDRSWITLLAVDAGYRRRKIGTKIVAALEDYFLGRDCATTWVSSYAPNYFTPGVDVNAYPEALEFFKSLGYQELLRPLSMDANLVSLTTPDWVMQKESELACCGNSTSSSQTGSCSPPFPQHSVAGSCTPPFPQHTPAGKVTIECFRPELILPLLDWMKAEFPGDWQRFARESMTKITLGEFRPDNVWVAHECCGNSPSRGEIGSSAPSFPQHSGLQTGSCSPLFPQHSADGSSTPPFAQHTKVLGYCQHDNAGRFGPFGVSSSERGRGIGAVLLFKCLHAMRAKGLHNAWFMWTDDKVARLYAEAGFVESRRFALLWKAIRP